METIANEQKKSSRGGTRAQGRQGPERAQSGGLPCERKKTAPGPKSRLTIAKRFARVADMDNNTAICTGCGEEKLVCCDSGYTEHADGTTEHDEPYCVVCCPSNHTVYSGVRSGYFERMDCDQ